MGGRDDGFLSRGRGYFTGGRDPIIGADHPIAQAARAAAAELRQPGVPGPAGSLNVQASATGGLTGEATLPEWMRVAIGPGGRAAVDAISDDPTIVLGPLGSATTHGAADAVSEVGASAGAFGKVLVVGLLGIGAALVGTKIYEASTAKAGR